MNSQVSWRTVARIAVWLEAIILIVVGAAMTAVRTVTPWDEFEEGGVVTATSGTPFDIWPIGLALLFVGLLTLSAVLLCEAFVSDRSAVTVRQADALP